MKKFFIFLIVFLLVINSAFAQTNNQKIYDTKSEVYEALKYLFVISNHALPSSTGPWSAAELLLMLDQIDYDQLEKGAKNAYNFAKDELYYELPENKYDFIWNFDANLEMYSHDNTTDYVEKRDWIYGKLDQKPFIHLGIETYAAENFYGFFDFDFRNSVHTGTELGETKLSTNLITMQNLAFNFNDVSLNFPFRAFSTFGGDNWTIQLGRDRVNWGAGESGNLIVGDNLEYHNMLRFATFFDSFKYTFISSFFPHPINYFDSGKIDLGNSQTQIITGLSAFLAHRFEGRFLDDKLNFTLTETMMYMSEEGMLDLQFFNPSMLFHNNYIRYMSNSILGFELDYTITNGLNIYGQLVVDEFALPGEPVPGKADWAFPTSFGYMLGLKGYKSYNEGILYSSLEAVKTDPYLYLRYGVGDTDQDSGEYGINYVVAIRNYSNSASSSVTYDLEFLGYKHGGDAFVGNLNVGYKEFNKFHIEGNAFMMAHGCNDMYSTWSEVTDGRKPSLPTHSGWLTEDHKNHGNHMDATAETSRNAISYTTVLGINGGYQLTSSLSLMAQIDYINVINYKNRKGETSNDLQMTVGLSYSI